MAKDILITPASGQIDFSDTAAASTISLYVRANGDIDFEGTAGNLFTISDSLTGSLMSVSDISGLPILEVFDTDKVVMGEFGSNALVVNADSVGIQTDDPQTNLHVHSSGTVSYITITNTTTGLGGGSDAGLTVGMNGLNAIIYNRDTGPMQFGTDAVARWQITSTGNFEPWADTTYNIGLSTTKRVQDIFLDPTTTTSAETTLFVHDSTTGALETRAASGMNLSEFNDDLTHGTGTVTSVAITGTDGIDVDSGSPITTSGTITLGLSGIANSALTNSTISGVSLGGTLAALSAGNGLSAAGTYTGATARTFALDFGELGVGGTLVGGDYLIAENGGVENRQLISSIPLSIFNDDLGHTAIVYGANNQIPYMNGTTAFQYSSGLQYDDTTLHVTTGGILADGASAFTVEDSATTTSTSVTSFIHNGGTVAPGFGTKVSFKGETSTNVDILMGEIDYVWTTTTHASRTSETIISGVTSAASRDRLTLTGTGFTIGDSANTNTAYLIDVLSTQATTHIDLSPKGIGGGVRIYSDTDNAAYLLLGISGTSGTIRTIETGGSESNIDLHLKVKGTGHVTVPGGYESGVTADDLVTSQWVQDQGYGSGSGTVTGTGTNNQVALWNGTTAIDALAAGTNTDVLTMVGGIPVWTDPISSVLKRANLRTTDSTTSFGSLTHQAIDWDATADFIDTDVFTHSTGTNPSRLEVEEDGVYTLKATMGWTINQTSNRMTMEAFFRVNGTTSYPASTGRSYHRGTTYGNATTEISAEISLSANDYIEVMFGVDIYSASYTCNLLISECEFTARKTTATAVGNTWRPLPNMADINDVTITSIASGELLTWNGSIFINETLAQAGIAATTHSHSNLTAGVGITGSTYIGTTARDWTIVSHAGTAGSIGTINVGADTVGVTLGTTSTSSFRGDYGNTAYTNRITSLTTTGSGVATLVSNVLNIPNTTYTHPNHSGHVSSVADGATTVLVAAITGQTATSTLTGADEFLVSDGGVIRRVDMTYFISGQVQVTTTATGTDELLVSDNGTLSKMDISAMNTYFNANLSFNNYSLPEATATVRGGLELFSNTDNPTAANSVTSTASRTYGLQLDSSGRGVINVPWTSGGVTIADTQVAYATSANTLGGHGSMTYNDSTGTLIVTKLQVATTSDFELDGSDNSLNLNVDRGFRLQNSTASIGNLTTAIRSGYNKGTSLTQQQTGAYQAWMQVTNLSTSADSFLAAHSTGTGDAFTQYTSAGQTKSFAMGLDGGTGEYKLMYAAAVGFGTAARMSTGTEYLSVSSAGEFTFNSNVGGGGTTNFLRADGTWAAAGGGTPSDITVAANAADTDYPVIFASASTGTASLYTDASIYYNPYDNALTVNALKLSANPTTANPSSSNQVLLRNITAGAIYRHTATNANTANALVHRDASGNFSAGTITASLAGYASGITVVATNDAATFYPVIVDGSSGNQIPEVDTNFSYNPSTNILTAPTFSGALSGNATSATNIDIDATSSSDTQVYPVFVAAGSTGNQLPFIDSGLVYNANTNQLQGTSLSFTNVIGTTDVSGKDIGIESTSSTDGACLSLYGGPGAFSQYSLLFCATATMGTHGGCTETWATYNVTSATTGRGWIWKSRSGANGTSGNVFSIDNSGTCTSSDTFTGTRFISNIATGTAPFTVSSTTKVTNLNVDQLDGYSSSFFLSVYGGTQTQGTTVISSTAQMTFNDNCELNFGTSAGEAVMYSDGTYLQLDMKADKDFYISDLTTTRFLFDSSLGAFHADNNITAYSTSVSDKRLKTNVNYMSPKVALELVLSLDSITYTHKYKDKDKVHGGYIAQEFENYLPHLITESRVLRAKEWGYKEKEQFKTINYTEVVPYITEAMKEQQKMIESQQKEIDELKRLVNTLINK